MKKKLLIAAIGATMGAANVAQADGLLFPFYQADSAAGVFSFLALANVVGTNSETHYIWNFDRLDTTTTTECVHEDAFGTLTAWDIAQATVTHPSLSTLDLPNHPQFLDASGVNYSLAEPSLGFMIVTNWVAPPIGGGYPVTASGESTLAGQVIVVDTVNGLITAQRGMNNPATNHPAGLEGLWNSIFTSHFSYDLTWYPDPVVSTQWYTLVTGTNMDNINNWTGAGILSNGFGLVYDRDENPRSGNVDLQVQCHAFLTRSDIMTPEQVAHSNQGGYMWATFAPAPNGFGDPATTPTHATGILMTKIETTTQLGGTGTFSLDNPWPNLPF
jgi:hypothetical protein